MRIFQTADQGIQGTVNQLRREAIVSDDAFARDVSVILAEVMTRGDAAVIDCTRRYENYPLEAANIEATSSELAVAAEEVSEADGATLKLAARRIEEYHLRQKESLGTADWLYQEVEGIILGQLCRPLRRVGIYAPGGRAAYPSSVLMAAIPARVAGVTELYLTSPLRGGKLNPLVAFAARICGINRVFKIGGAQAIAALAYGTETIPPVDKIVGPGNAYVAAAKKLVYGQVAIDMIAGPSEIMIIADQMANPEYIAADMIGQAEHDEMAAAILITDDPGLARKVERAVAVQLSDLPRRGIASRSLKERGAVIIVRDMDEAFEVANLYAPEHLEIMLKQPRSYLERVNNAGCVFLGDSTPETLGDYLAGSNHILPTSGSARFSSPLGVYDFIKRTSVVSFAAEELRLFGPEAARFARMEGLEGHARSVAVRLMDPKKPVIAT